MPAPRTGRWDARAALRTSLVPNLVHQPRFVSRIRVLPARRWLRQSECTNSFDEQQQSNHLQEGDGYVIETKEQWRYSAPNNLRPGGGGRGVSRERCAYRGSQTARIRNLSRTRRTTRP